MIEVFWYGYHSFKTLGRDLDFEILPTLKRFIFSHLISVWCSRPRIKRVFSLLPFLSFFEQSLQIAELSKAKRFCSYIQLNQTVSYLLQDLCFLTPSLPNYVEIPFRTSCLAHIQQPQTHLVAHQNCNGSLANYSISHLAQAEFAEKINLF